MCVCVHMHAHAEEPGGVGTFDAHQQSFTVKRWAYVS